jgi:hypothetical protein
VPFLQDLFSVAISGLNQESCCGIPLLSNLSNIVPPPPPGPAGQLSGLRSLTSTLDEPAEVTNGEIEWEVDSGEKLDEEEIPA